MRAWLGFIIALLLAGSAMAEPYPSKPIRIIVPYAPGGINDLVARIAADGLQSRFKQTIIVENKPGGNGTIGARELLRSAPDGYTLMMGGLGAVTRAAMDPQYPIDLTQDLVPIAGFARVPTVMVVSLKTPANSVAEFVDYARSRRNSMTFGSTGTGTLNHLAAALFMKAADVQLLRIPYKGGTGSINDLVGGQIDVVFEVFPVAKGQVTSGQVRALAVTSGDRLTQLPDVPTMVEAGFPSVNITGWVGLYGPRGLPDSTREKLASALAELLQTPETQSRLQAIGFMPIGTEMEQFAEFHASEIKRWNAFVEEQGLRP